MPFGPPVARPSWLNLEGLSTLGPDSAAVPYHCTQPDTTQPSRVCLIRAQRSRGSGGRDSRGECRGPAQRCLQAVGWVAPCCHPPKGPLGRGHWAGEVRRPAQGGGCVVLVGPEPMTGGPGKAQQPAWPRWVPSDGARLSATSGPTVRPVCCSVLWAQGGARSTGLSPWGSQVCGPWASGKVGGGQCWGPEAQEVEPWPARPPVLPWRFQCSKTQDRQAPGPPAHRDVGR